jgi:hypothetical protein
MQLTSGGVAADIVEGKRVLLRIDGIGVQEFGVVARRGRLVERLEFHHFC